MTVNPCSRYTWPDRATAVFEVVTEPYEMRARCAECDCHRTVHLDQGAPMPADPQQWDGFLLAIERRDAPVVRGLMQSISTTTDGTPVGLWVRRVSGPHAGSPIYVPWLAITGVGVGW